MVNDREILRTLKKLSGEFLRARIREGSEPVGCVREVDIGFVVPDSHYHRRLGLLELLDRNIFHYYVRALNTQYFSSRMRLFARRPERPRLPFGFLPALIMVYRYRRLYRSMRRNGLLWEPGDVSSVPWLFASRECFYRLDGHHRASIARHLGHETMKVLLITPKDVLALSDLPDRYRAFLGGLHEPTVDLMGRSGLASDGPQNQ
jgi:hypothetical protein